MHWEILIVPLIALGVWILGTLFKGGEDDRLKKSGRRPGASAGRPAQRRPVTDLDRFLEEARRRRESEERKPPPPPPPRQPPRERPTRTREAPPRVAAPPVAVPVARPVVKTDVVEVVPDAAPVAEAPAPPPPAPTVTRDPRPSPVVRQVRDLLSKPQSAGVAFVLREIFDRPRCQRRR